MTPAPAYQRDHPDPVADLPPLVLDRQRVVHAAAFRRLQHKTQVFVALEADHFRTRLTHTLEVAHLARVLAEALRLSPGLAEVVALAHDLGHPPFGHAGERALDECLRGHGGFEHNAHTLRVVEYLEHPYPDFRGLNLTRVVRECLAKHSTRYDRPGAHPLHDGTPPPPEGVVVDLADRLTYGLHDLQDGLYAGLLQPRDLAAVALWRGAHDGAVPADESWRGRLRPAIDRMQQLLVADVCIASSAGDEPRLSPAMEQQLGELESLLLERVYRDERLVQMDERARRVVRETFDAFTSEPGRLPPRFARRVDRDGLHRVVADYIAGMTDRFCLQERERLLGPGGGA